MIAEMTKEQRIAEYRRIKPRYGTTGNAYRLGLEGKPKPHWVIDDGGSGAAYEAGVLDRKESNQDNGSE